MILSQGEAREIEAILKSEPVLSALAKYCDAKSSMFDDHLRAEMLEIPPKTDKAIHYAAQSRAYSEFIRDLETAVSQALR